MLNFFRSYNRAVPAELPDARTDGCGRDRGDRGEGAGSVEEREGEEGRQQRQEGVDVGVVEER